MPSKTSMPNLNNATPGSIADWLGEVRKQQKDLKKLEGFYKQALQARRPENDDVIHGEKFKAIFSHKTRTALDQTPVKEEMGQEWWDAHCKTTEYDQIDSQAVD